MSCIINDKECSIYAKPILMKFYELSIDGSITNCHLCPFIYYDIVKEKGGERPEKDDT